MESWETIVFSMGGSLVLTGLLGFLLREWISARIRKSIEHEYSVKEAKLKAELDGELVGLKAGYQKILDENQIRFSRLHADQAEAIKTLYHLIHRTHSKVAALVSVLQIAPSGADELEAHWHKQEQDAVDAFEACNAFFHENRILLPEDVCFEMDEFLSIARKAYRDFARRKTRPEGWDDADDAMRGAAVSLKRNLESRFRQILGMLPTREEGPARARWGDGRGWQRLIAKCSGYRGEDRLFFPRLAARRRVRGMRRLDQDACQRKGGRDAACGEWRGHPAGWPCLHRAM